MSQVRYDVVTNPSAETLTVSTIRTVAGGAPPSGASWTPFTTADFDDLNIWPFETMIFHVGSRRGLYHEAHETEAEAIERHAAIVGMIEAGLEFPGVTVTQDAEGTPTLTREQWEQRLARKATA